MLRRLLAFAQRNAVGLLALFVALGGTSYAVTTSKFVGKDKVVHACANSKSGIVRLVLAGKGCRRGEQSVSWNQRGPTGSAGKQGGQGAQGQPGPAGSIQGAPAGGALAGSYPNPTLAAAATPTDIADNPNTASDPCSTAVPQTLILCGTSSNRWLNGGFGLPGLQIWRDQIGQLHLRGSVSISTALNNSQPALFVLPPGDRPQRFLSFPIATGANAGAQTEKGALLVIGPDGFVGVVSNSGDAAVHLGDLAFRTDA